MERSSAKNGKCNLKSPARLSKALHVPKPLHHSSSCFRNKNSLKILTFPNLWIFPVFCLLPPAIPRLRADSPYEHPNTKRREKQAKPNEEKKQEKPERAGLDSLFKEVSISKVGRRKVEIHHRISMNHSRRPIYHREPNYYIPFFCCFGKFVR